MDKFDQSFLDVAELVTPRGYRLYRQVGRDRFVAISEPETGIENVLLAHRNTPRELLHCMGVQE